MPNWLESAIFYEIYPQSFYDANGDGIGDIRGIIEKLSYVKELGANAIWINPCFDSPFWDAGYDVRDYKKVAPRYGTNSDLKELFDRAHEKNIHVILDLVPGHTSFEHEWFKESMKPEKNEYSDRYIWTDSVWNNPPEYRYVSGMTDREASFYVNFFSSQPALNYGFHNVKYDWQIPEDHPTAIKSREAIKDVMRYWLDMGCDGFRVDMAEVMVKEDPDKIGTSKLWRNVREMLDAEYPNAALISEWGFPNESIAAGFHADFYLNHDNSGYKNMYRETDPNTNEVISYFCSASNTGAKKFADRIIKDFNAIKNYGYIGLITGNHDSPRMRKFLNTDELKIGYAMLLTLPGVPFIYYGDEIGMKFIENLVSKEGGYMRTGARTPMQWDNTPGRGFSTADKDNYYLPVDSSHDAPTVESQIADTTSLLNVVKSLTKLRNNEKELWGNGDFEILFAEEKHPVFAYRHNSFVMIINPKNNDRTVKLDISGELIYSIGEKIELKNNSVFVPANSFSIIKAY